MAQTIFITGCSTGIGRDTALYFADKGWQVFATMRNPEGRVAESRHLRAHKNITLFHLDVTDPVSIGQALTAALEIYEQIDVLVNNAGYALNGIFEDTTVQQIEKQFATNVFGLMNMTREILPHFRSRKKGTLINIASVGGRIGFPLYSLYQSTKFAVEGFSEALSYELRPQGIRVRLVEPGVILTDFYTRSMDHTEETRIDDYRSYARVVKEIQDKTGRRGLQPVGVAKCIYRAATSRRWKLRYPVGGDARMLFLLRYLLPFSWFKGLLRRLLAGGL